MQTSVKNKMDIRSKDEFIYFMQRATEDTSNDCYIELYNILLRWESAGFTFTLHL